MQSLALLASLIFLCVASIGPAAVLLQAYGYVYIGGTLGLLAVSVGLWWCYVMRGPVAVVGLATAAAGLWAALQAYKHDLPH